jgi:hypothetical protein
MSEVELRAVALITDWRKVSTFRCRAVVGSGGEASEFELHAEPNHSSYYCTDLATGRVSAYDDATRERITFSTVVPVYPYEVNSEALPARLAFPLSLGIWGRRGDAYRMVRAVEHGDRMVVEIANNGDAAVVGELSIDVARRAIVRLDSPSLTISYEEIEPAPNRFWPRG